MKKNLLSSLAFVSIAGSTFAQLQVSTAPENKKAILEEFTGIYCGYCPDGHQIANAIKAADPNNVVLINIHAGYYATAVVAGEPDLTSPVGTAINNMPGMNIQGYPAGDMNRGLYANSSTGMADDRGLWAGWASTVKSQPAYCNVAVQGTVDVVTRVLTVEAQVYYTANSPVATNSLNIFLLEDSVLGPQHNYGAPIPYNAGNYNQDGSYNHNHVLRHALTPNFGLTIPVTTSGTTFTTTATYTVPLIYGAISKTNPCFLGNLKLAAFVTETNTTTINGNNGDIIMTNFASALDLSPNSMTVDPNACSGNNFGIAYKFNNLGSSVVTSATFNYVLNGTVAGSFNWTGSVKPMAYSESILGQTANIPASASAVNNFSIVVASVNGQPDQNAANNAVTKVIAHSPAAHATNMEFNFNQNWQGSQSSWTIYNEVTNAVILDSPQGSYSDLGNPNFPQDSTVLWTYTFTASPATCYKIVVNDAGGDGINNGPLAGGVGFYNLKSNGTLVLSSNGKYGAGETRLFRAADTLTSPLDTTVATSIKNAGMRVQSANLYPNPTSGGASLVLNLVQNETVGITVINSMGQQVYTSKDNKLDAGTTTFSLNAENWASGIYFVNVSTVNGGIKKKLTVTH